MVAVIVDVVVGGAAAGEAMTTRGLRRRLGRRKSDRVWPGVELVGTVHDREEEL